MTNVVIPFLTNPRTRNIELKYALRCLPAHDKVYIIGDNPNLPNIIHIPFKDKPGIKYRSENIYRKILKGFEVMDEMYFHSDDHFVSKTFAYEYFYDGTLDQMMKPSTSEAYKLTVRNTINYLRERNLPTKFFNVHCPVYYERDKFPVIDHYPDYGYAIKSLYCNINGIKGVPYPDLKIRQHLPKEKLMQLLRGRKFFSSDDNYVNKTFIDILEALYPVASRYENTAIPV